ncbi:MAG: protein-disulfide reductase DsbD domain-containing protein [Phycisphaerae bacterium]
MSTAPVLLSLVVLIQPATPEPPKFTARLLAAHESVQPGGQTDLLVEIEVGKPWHIYDPIVLDTGLPTTVKFTPPPGVTIGELRYPPPSLGETAGLEYLEHSGRIHALAPLKLAADVEPGRTLTIAVKVTGLACIEMCLPVETTTSLQLPVTAELGKPANEKLFKEAREKLAPLLANARYVKGSELRVSKARIGIDEPAELVATIRIQKGHHIQDRDPGVDMLIASRLFIEKIAGIEFAEEKKQIWPKPHVREFPGFGRVREQSGEVKIRVPFRITDTKFPSGPVTLRALFRYQACTDAGQCFPPEFGAGPVRFMANTPNRPAAADARLAERPAPIEEADDGAAPPAGTGTSQATAREPSEPSEADVMLEGETDTLASVIPPFTEEAWADGIPWRAWRPGLAAGLSRAGHMVYVDYTATWCLTCQTNKKLVLETDEIREKMRKLRVVPIKADFTNEDPVMLAEIKSHGHPTVPLNLVYAAAEPETPGRLPGILTKKTVIRALEDPLAFVDGGGRRHLLAVLLAGFLGGLILNVMPCVLPVISIKILSFVQQAGEDPGRVLRLGLAFCAGIMVWFWAFAGLSSIGKVPWQYPEVVITLSSILFVFSLNLFGVFEIVLPGAAAGKLDAIAAREGYTGAFLKGLLATLLGTACTAPFLAGAMAYALTQPAWIVYLVFSAAGVGMASPYLVLSAKPGWLKFIPRPGPWMVTFKQAAGFVLLGTVVWLLLILADQVDGKGVVWTVAFFGFLGLAAWMLGRIKPTWQTGGRATMWTASAMLAVLGFYFCYFVMYDWNGRKAQTMSPGGAAAQRPATTLSQAAGSTNDPELVRKDR